MYPAGIFPSVNYMESQEQMSRLLNHMGCQERIPIDSNDLFMSHQVRNSYRSKLT